MHTPGFIHISSCYTTPPIDEPPTPYPTPQPTRVPTHVPSIKPSVKPSVIPTIQPTKTTSRPTGAPSKTPTNAPSKAPSYRPTPSPTKAPVATEQPSPRPRTMNPTIVPTATPTAIPRNPRELMSNPPTSAPSRANNPPVNNPTTKAPTKFPTVSPITTINSQEPSLFPTVTPTKFPAVDLVGPTPLPTSIPTAEPLQVPTTYTTWEPSSSTSTTTTHHPSFRPSLPPTYRDPTDMIVTPSTTPTEQLDDDDTPVSITRTNLGVQVQLFGVDLMKDDEITEWLEISETWLENYYNDYFISQASEVQRETRAIRVRLEFVSQSVSYNRNSIPTNTLTYNEIITYNSREAANIFSPEALREAAFADENAVTALMSTLRESIPVMAELGDIDLVAVSTSKKQEESNSDQVSSDRISALALVFIILGLLAVAIGGSVKYYRVYHKEGEVHNSVRPPPPSPPAPPARSSSNVSYSDWIRERLSL